MLSVTVLIQCNKSSDPSTIFGRIYPHNVSQRYHWHYSQILYTILREIIHVAYVTASPTNDGN